MTDYGSRLDSRLLQGGLILASSLIEIREPRGAQPFHSFDIIGSTQLLNEELASSTV